MADRVSASIVTGGPITAAAFAELAELIEAEGLSTEWDGTPFQPTDRSLDEPLSLYATSMASAIPSTSSPSCCAAPKPSICRGDRVSLGR